MRRVDAGGVIFAPEDTEPVLNNAPVVFCAGSIDMGKSEDWQKKLIEALEDVDCVILNPRRKDWDSSWKQEMENDKFREQVEWELDGMEDADVIALCLTKDSKAPISLMEMGLHAGEGKMVVCCPEGFWRKGNVDIVCKRYGVPVYEDFGEFVGAVKERLRLPRIAARIAGSIERFPGLNNDSAMRMLAARMGLRFLGEDKGDLVDSWQFADRKGRTVVVSFDVDGVTMELYGGADPYTPLSTVDEVGNLGSADVVRMMKKILR